MISGKGVHTRHHVLVVGCRQDSLATVRQLLEAEGHRVAVADDNREALRLADLRPPCLLLLDMDTLGGSGLKLCRQMSADSRLASIPVAMMARGFESGLVEECGTLGNVDFIRKPFDPLGLRSRVQTLLRLHETLLVNAQGQEELRTISDASRDAIMMMDDRGAIVHWSRTAETMFGYPREEVLGRMLHALLVPSRFSEPFHKAFPGFQASGRGNIIGKPIEMVALRKGGEEFPVEVLVSPTRVQERWFAIGIVRDITARKQAETRTREAESAQRTTFESLPTGVVIIDAATRRIEQVNPAAAALLGAPADQIVGHVCHQHFCPSQEGRCPVMDLGQRIDDSQRELLHADGTRVPVRKSVRPIQFGGRGKLVEMFTSLSEEKGREEQYRALFECSLDALMALAPPQWRFTRANPACIRLFGARTEQDVLACEPWRLSPDFQPDGRPSAEKALEMILKAVEEGTNFFEWTHRRLDGTDFPATVLLTRMTVGGEHHLQAIVRDITEQRQTEARLAEERQSRESVELELLQAQRAETSAGLAVGIAREIRTSVQFIGDNAVFLREAFTSLLSLLDNCRAALASLASRGIDPSSAEALAAVEATAAEANLSLLTREIPAAIGQSLDDVSQVVRIVGALKDLSHPPSRDREPADLNRTIEGLVLVTRNLWKRVADLETELDPRLPEVPCFVDQISGALLDLIANAASAVESIGVRARGEKGSIRIVTRLDGNSAEIRVSDTGPGIPEEQWAAVFASGHAPCGAARGTGRGLAVTHQTVVKRHGGTLHFETQVGKGTTFVLRLPIRATERAAA